MITTSEYWNNRFKDWGNAPLTSFKANTKYSYTIYVKLTDEAVKNGYYFDRDKTKLSINGEFINIDSKYVGIDEGNPTVATFGEVLKMTPTSTDQSQDTTTGGSTSTNVENPKTGDNVMMYLATGILSIIGLAGASVIVYRKKQTN